MIEGKERMNLFVFLYFLHDLSLFLEFLPLKSEKKPKKKTPHNQSLFLLLCNIFLSFFSAPTFHLICNLIHTFFHSLFDSASILVLLKFFGWSIHSHFFFLSLIPFFSTPITSGIDFFIVVIHFHSVLRRLFLCTTRCIKVVTRLHLHCILFVLFLFGIVYVKDVSQELLENNASERHENGRLLCWILLYSLCWWFCFVSSFLPLDLLLEIDLLYTVITREILIFIILSLCSSFSRDRRTTRRREN